MPARVVVVHDEPEFLDAVATALESAGHQVATFPDPMAAWDAMEAAQEVEVLVTRVQFEPGRSNGIALAAIARLKRPEIRVLFAALPQHAPHTDGLGTFMSMPIPVPEVVEAVTGLLDNRGRILSDAGGVSSRISCVHGETDF
jgi:DNA-binding NtrC family response regulator